MITLRLIGVHSGEPTEHDGLYVVDYDPTPICEDGHEPYIYLELAERREDARQFATLEEAIRFYRMESAAGPRPDGQPDRPLTAYTVEFDCGPPE
jgi:hypothetical protein